MATETLDTHHKALSINLDAKIYGSFAEIGAGQEVARWFLRVGAASGTVAKTISAYDKEVSDDLYGAGTRYVSRERLAAMLDREWALLLRQLGEAREAKARIFIFADTMSARNFAGTNECHGWMGLRFQAEPGGAPQEIVLHVNMRDDANVLQQEAIGILGVNLIHAAFHRRKTYDDFLCALFEDLDPGRLEVDFIAGSGTEIEGVDARAAIVELARAGHAEAVVLPADGALVPPTDLLHGRPVLLEPGRFEEPSAVFGDMLRTGLDLLRAELAPDAKPPICLCALPVHPDDATADCLTTAEILKRADEIRAMGYGVLISRRRELFRMSELVTRFTVAPIRFVTGLSTLIGVFRDQQNEALAGSLLEALARLFVQNVRVYAYPMRADVLTARLDDSFVYGEGRDKSGASLVTVQDLEPRYPYGHLYQYLLHSKFIVPISVA